MTITNDPHVPAATSADPRRAATGRADTARAERRLRGILRANAATSVVSGVVLAVAPDRLDDLLGTGHPGWVRLVGLAVVVFGIDVAWLSRRDRSDLVRFTPVVIGADVVWVAASVATIVLGWFSGAGIAAVVAMALAVDTFASLQFLTWRAMRRNP